MPPDDSGDLFSLGGSEDGYEKWRLQNAAQRQAAMESRAAEELPVSGDEAGFAAWREKETTARREFERRWGVPIGKRVRVALVDGSPPLEGVLNVVEGCTKQPRKQVMLRIGKREFPSTQIHSLVRLS